MQISHYEIGELIGQGGMGRVFKARDTRLDRWVAFKIIDRSPTADEWESRFLNEAKVLASLQHPNIVALFDVGVAEGKPFLVMEHLEGVSLQSLLQEQTELPLRQILGIGVQICQALEYAHSKRVIHRDIKPGNVFRLKNNTVKVLDFGLSITGPSTTPVPSTTRTGDLSGTYRYMSPEQRQGFALDGQSDVYSAGLVIHELLAGHSTSADAATVEGVPSVAAANGYLPVLLGNQYCDEINNILHTALAPDRLERYMAIRNFGHALANLKQRIERSEITTLYERGCALVRADVKTHDEEITRILIELDQIDPACEEARMLMDQALRTSFDSGFAELMRLIEEKKDGEAKQVLKKLYMNPSLNQLDVGLLDFVASRICPEGVWSRQDVAQAKFLDSLRGTQTVYRVPAEKAAKQSHGLGQSSKGISGKLIARLKSLLRSFSGMPRN